MDKVKKPSKKDLEKEEISKIWDTLEDISTLTPEYIRSKMESFEDSVYCSDTCSELLSILQKLNNPSEGKNYIVPYKNYFIVNKGGWILKVKTIEVFSVAVCTYASQFITDILRRISDRSSNSKGEGEISFLKRKVETIRHMAYPQFSDPCSKLYTMFKSTLEVL